MNFSKNFKWQLVVVALGASLVLTGKVYSQEIENTNFDAPAASMGSNFNTNAPAAVNTAAANPQMVYTPATGAAIRATNEMGVLSAPSFSLTAGSLLAIAILATVCLIIRKASPNNRNNWKNTWNQHSARKTTPIAQKPQVLHS
jgi:hypothetical protein